LYTGTIIDSSGIEVSQVSGFLIVNDPHCLAAGKPLRAFSFLRSRRLSRLGASKFFFLTNATD
jgi:hypothetical protein